MLQDIVISNSVLKNELHNYARPNDKISYMMHKGELIGLGKGHYATKHAIETNMYLPHQTANVLYGPSYISRYSALSFYGALAESPTRIESMTMKRSKTLQNSLGIFEYSTLANTTVFSAGICSKKINDTNTILIASAEKAICDIIYTTPQLVLKNIDDLIYFLEDDIRMDLEILQHAMLNDLETCIQFGKKKKEIQLLLQLIYKLF
jgi:hypothetical protein